MRLARCQILLGAPDRGSPSCADPAANLTYVRSGVASRWIPSAEEPPPHEAVTASTQLSVIDRPTLPAASPPEAVAERLRDLMPGARASGQSVPRLALSQPDVRVYVAPADGGRVCVVALEGAATASGSCASRTILASRGALTFTTSAAGTRRVTGLVGDGMDRVATGNGGRYDVVTGGVLQVGGKRPGVYHGVFAPAVGAVELDAGDGRKRRFATVEGHVLFEMPARTDGAARGPVSVTTLDRAGVALVKQQLPDGSVGP